VGEITLPLLTDNPLAWQYQLLSSAIVLQHGSAIFLDKHLKASQIVSLIAYDTLMLLAIHAGLDAVLYDTLMGVLPNNVASSIVASLLTHPFTIGLPVAAILSTVCAMTVGDNNNSKMTFLSPISELFNHLQHDVNVIVHHVR
jgi:hypothetical protein